MNYVSAREGVPVPTKPYERAGRAEWVVCGCGHKGRPGAFHICIDLGEPEPVVAPKPKPAPKPQQPRKPRTQSLKSSTPRRSQRTKRCACGTLIYPQSIECMPCSVISRAARKASA